MYDLLVEPVNHALRKLMLKMLKPQAGMQVLEIGCGTGTNLELLHQNGCEVSGVDLSAGMLEQAKIKLAGKADLRQADAAAMPFDNDSFDVVLTMLTLHEMPGDIRSFVLKEMIRVVKPGGQLFFVDYHPGPLQFPKGWFYKAMILFFEILAGREHFRNYRHFIAHKGLPPLLQSTHLSVEKEKIISGGNIALYGLKSE